MTSLALAGDVCRNALLVPWATVGNTWLLRGRTHSGLRGQLWLCFRARSGTLFCWCARGGRKWSIHSPVKNERRPSSSWSVVVVVGEIKLTSAICILTFSSQFQMRLCAHWVSCLGGHENLGFACFNNPIIGHGWLRSVDCGKSFQRKWCAKSDCKITGKERKRRAELGFEPRTSYMWETDPKQEFCHWTIQPDSW